MSFQTSRIQNVDVGGAPPSSLSKDNEWEIINVRYHGFENLTSTRDEYVESPEFTCFGHQWRLKLYPGGRINSDDGMVSISLQNLSNKSIKVQYGFAVKNKGIKTGWNGFVSKDKGYEFSPYGTTAAVDNQIYDSWGYKNFCKRTPIINALVDGTLIIEVRMRKIGEKTTTYSPFIPENPLAKNILLMFNDEESADVVFEVENEKVETSEHKKAKTTTTFHAHRSILHNSSSSLLGELCQSRGDDVNAVSITDATPEIFKHLLYYLYGGKVSDEELKSSAEEIIDAADKYGIVGLKLEAEACYVQSTTITFENAIDNLLYADATNFALIKEAVIDFIAENSMEAVTKLSFDNVPGQVITDVLAAVNRGKAQGSTSTDENDFRLMRVSTLRKMLHKKGLDVDGSREAMIARLEHSD